MPSARQRDLLDQPRWSWLSDFLHRWYAHALEASDGASLREIDALEDDIDLTAPHALREWFELIGHRLETVQDCPARPDRLLVHDGRLVVWGENQGCWLAVVPPGGDDPQGFFAPDPDLAPAPLSTLLRTMTVSDTVVGAWAGQHRGPLGQLGPAVRGGVIEDYSPQQLAACLAHYPRLGIPGQPYAPSGPIGHTETIIRAEPDGVWLEWMTASDAAYAELTAVIGQRPH